LLQLNADLPDKFPGHERRVYLFGCKNKACRRKEGSVRGIRTTQIPKVDGEASTATATQPKPPAPQAEQPEPKQQTNIGESLFGVQPSKNSNQNPNPFSASANPFSTSSQPAAANSNPFAPATASPAPAKKEQQQQPVDEEKLSQTFAEKARIANTNTAPTPKPTAGPKEPWPAQSAFPTPYPTYYIDADKEYLDPEPAAVPQNVRMAEAGEFETSVGSGGGGNTADDKAAVDSLMDKEFQKFADRLAQNPEQILRYDFGGQPLLYSKKDAVGAQWPRVPGCGACGAARVFELQLTPHAITELEAEDMSLDGMDWGTIIMASCGADCGGEKEEWVGVQWEELAAR